MRDKRGRPIRNPHPPVCERTPCGSRERKPKLKPWQRHVFELYTLARRLNQPIFTAGLMESDALIVRMLLAIDEIVIEKETQDTRALKEQMRKIGGKSAPR